MTFSIVARCENRTIWYGGGVLPPLPLQPVVPMPKLGLARLPARMLLIRD